MTESPCLGPNPYPRNFHRLAVRPCDEHTLTTLHAIVDPIRRLIDNITTGDGKQWQDFFRRQVEAIELEAAEYLKAVRDCLPLYRNPSPRADERDHALFGQAEKGGMLAKRAGLVMVHPLHVPQENTAAILRRYAYLTNFIERVLSPSLDDPRVRWEIRLTREGLAHLEETCLSQQQQE
ncbi:MAG: hypothetical protein PHE68_01785 [Candidatus Peribacteraceae bacterium]|nr:hypothetical protein [Candidatus Peribacteraceae bacterium]